MAELEPVAHHNSETPNSPAGVDATRRPWVRVALAVAAAGGLLALALGVRHIATLDGLGRFNQWVDAHGRLAPAVFIGGYVVAESLFVPALPLTLLGGMVFGPLWGTMYVSAAATLAAALAFLIARHALRQRVERWMSSSPRLRQLDAAVAEHGWRILVITRLVPLFPFNLQNFAYGLTPIRLSAYVVLSWICMLPGTAAYIFAGAALGESGRNPGRTITYLAAGGILLVAVSLAPRWLKRRSRSAQTLLQPR